MAKSKTKGKTTKARTKITAEMKNKMREMFDEGIKKIDIARALNLSYSAVRKNLA